MIRSPGKSHVHAAGTHTRQKGEEKRLLALKGTRIRRAEHLRQLRVDQVEAQFEIVRREVSSARDGERTAAPSPRPVHPRAFAFAL